jgi:hypothetical protein
MLPFTAGGATAFFGGCVASPQFLQTIHQSSEYRYLLWNFCRTAFAILSPSVPNGWSLVR